MLFVYKNADLNFFLVLDIHVVPCLQIAQCGAAVRFDNYIFLNKIGFLI